MKICAFWALAALFLTGMVAGAAEITLKASVNPKDGATMMWVPAGEFLMGTTADEIQLLLQSHTKLQARVFADEQPQHRVHTDGYWIYKTEVTVAQYRRFCTATGRAMPKVPKWDTDNFPVVNVTWFDAAAYAEWAGGRLPSEAEWEKAARGPESLRFPWGNEWDEQKCNNISDDNPLGGGVKAYQASPVGSYPQSDSVYGVQDMAGNVWEWCRDWYDNEYYAQAPAKNPRGPVDGELRVLRGGSWGSSVITIRSSARHADSPDMTYVDDGGFRCVVEGKKAGK